eukprot:8538511-Pyramimonas_sp.AAC.1
MIVERPKAPRCIVWSVRRVSADPVEAFTKLPECMITSRNNTSLPAALHARLIHRAHRWKIPQGTSIIDSRLTPASKGSIPW